MTFTEAFKFYLHNPEGPFPPEVWALIKHLFRELEIVCPLVAGGRITDEGSER